MSQARSTVLGRKGFNVEMNYDEAKTSELILYIAMATEADETAGSTKLNKIPYFADVAHIRHHGRPITGAEYQKLPQGPALRRTLPIIEQLEREGRAKIVERDYYGNVQKRLFVLDEPDLTVFSAEEIATIDNIVRQLWGKTATEVSEHSHQDVGWRAVGEGETIPYSSLAFVGEPEVTERSRAKAQELVDKLAANG